MPAHEDLANQLETLIDRYGIDNVIAMLGFVCGEKAEHIATNYQDASQGKEWIKLSADLDKLLAEVEGWYK
jgi:hypothetical protein